MLRTNRSVLIAGLVAGIVCTASSTAAAAGTPAFTGSAYALSVQTTLADAPLAKIDPVPSVTYPAGGTKSLVELGPEFAGLASAEALTASSNVGEKALHSKATIAKAVVKDILRAKVVTAECHATADGKLSGSSDIAELKVLGKPINTNLSGPIDVLGVATVTINEQIRQGDTLTVNAVHIVIGGKIHNIVSADIVLSQARCSAERDTETTPPATTTTGTTSTSPTTATSTSPPTDTTTSEPGSSTTSQDAGPGNDEEFTDVTPAANDGDLADTGASGLLPMFLIGAALLGGGLVLLIRVRRDRGTAGQPSDSQS